MTRIGRYLLGTVLLAPLLAGCGDTVTPSAVTGAPTVAPTRAAPAASPTASGPQPVPTTAGTAQPLPGARQTGVPNLPVPVETTVPQGSAPGGGEQARLL